jgi:hypothetical protein
MNHPLYVLNMAIRDNKLNAYIASSDGNKVHREALGALCTPDSANNISVVGILILPPWSQILTKQNDQPNAV